MKYIGYSGLGKQVRDILHIDDLIDLVDIQINSIRKIKNKIYNAGGGLSSSASLREMTYICEKITDNKLHIDFELKERTAYLRIYISDNSKINSEIGWIPKRNVKTIFQDIYMWIRSNEAQLEKILK